MIHPTSRFERKQIAKKKADGQAKKKRERHSERSAKLDAIKAEEDQRLLRELVGHVP
jgi:hypothetical protein